MTRPGPVKDFTRSAGRGKRADIQGLRTIAVGLVIAYHLFPDSLPGGFVGVDVFLVISGYLIIGSLVRELAKTGRISLKSFYARRIRRLLPASTVVLVAVMAATVCILPQGRWQSVSRDIVASALQVQNWNQALSSTSYESAGELVSPVQHFWSLAVEEQFYLVIPLLLILAVGVSRLASNGGQPKRYYSSVLILCLLCTVSFAHSVVFSAQSHDVAYFATTTRMWELGAGGLTAVLLSKVQLGSFARFAFGWLGLVILGICSFTFSTQWAFPGYVALLPVLGTILIIQAGVFDPKKGREHSLTVNRLLSVKPVVFLGDISYSLYLWHWPVIVFYVYAADHRPGVLGTAGILALSLLLAVLSYFQIEQRFRGGPAIKQGGGRHLRLTTRTRGAYVLAGALVVTSFLAASGPWLVVAEKENRAVQLESSPGYPGALAFNVESPAPVPKGLAILPDPAVASKDVPLTYVDGCGNYDPAKFTDAQCQFGATKGVAKVALVGDSHAGQYVDPLAAIGRKEGWKIHAMVRNGCPFSASPPASATTTFGNCSAQNAVTLRKILNSGVKDVVMAAMTPYGYRKALGWGWSSDEVLREGYIQLMRPLVAAGISVHVIADTPYPEVSVPDCVAKHGAEAADCATAEADHSDPLLAAAKLIPEVRVVNLNHLLCKDRSCPPVIGNVLVYRDNHLTNTFAKSLEFPLEAALNIGS